MTERLQIGLIGCGSQGQFLSEALTITGQADLVACADVNPEAAERVRKICGYKHTYNDYAQMLSEAALDAVIIAVTHDQLQPAALAAVAAGKHVMVEKPMALTTAAGREVVATAKEAGVNLMVGYTLRFMPERVLMKELLDKGVVGDLAHVTGGQLIGPIVGWLADPARGGGPLFYIGSHVIDQILWVVDHKAERVFAQVQRHADGGVETAAHLTIRFAGDVVAQVITSQMLGGRYGWIDVLGSEGRMRSEWESDVLYVHSKNIDTYRHPMHIRVLQESYYPVSLEAQSSVVAAKYINVWAAELSEFANSIVENREPAVTGEDGVRVLEIIDAAFESACTGQPVQL